MRIFLFFISLFLSMTLCAQTQPMDPNHHDRCPGNGCMYLGIYSVSFQTKNQVTLEIILPNTSHRITSIGTAPLCYSNFKQEGRYVYITLGNENMDRFDGCIVRTSIVLETDDPYITWHPSSPTVYHYYYHLDCDVTLR